MDRIQDANSFPFVERSQMLALFLLSGLIGPASTAESPSPASSSAIGSTITPTKIWINEVEDYSKLSPCAEAPISNIMRDMSYGCGDGGRLTSYTCFCTNSYTKMTEVLLLDVFSRCIEDVGTEKAGSQGVSAQGVFYQYCQIGVQKGLVPAATTVQGVFGRNVLPQSVRARLR